MSRRLRTVLAAVGSLWLAGCSAGGVFGIADVVTQQGDDNDTNAAIRDLSKRWAVAGYSGEGVGGVTVPGDANFVWVFRADLTFTATADAPLRLSPQGEGEVRHEGRWRITDSRNRIMVLTLTRRRGTDITTGEQVEVIGRWRTEAGQLVLTTAVLEGTEIRYVMREAPP